MLCQGFTQNDIPFYYKYQPKENYLDLLPKLTVKSETFIVCRDDLHFNHSTTRAGRSESHSGVILQRLVVSYDDCSRVLKISRLNERK